MRTTFLALLTIVVFGPFAVTAAFPNSDDSQIIFPHIADGGGYRTVLLLTNGTGSATTATVAFFTNAGAPLIVTIGGTAASSFPITIPAGGSAKIETAGAGKDTSTGWAKVTTSPAAGLNGNAVFQLFKEGALFSEASVQAAVPAIRVEFYADEEGGFNTGLALANPGTATAAGTLTLRGSNGEIVGTSPVSLAPGHQTASFLFQLLPGVPSGRAEINLTRGTLSVAVLRYHSTAVFSTVSVGPPGGSGMSAFFSPAGGVRPRIIAEIGKATSTIDIAIYSFTADEIREALKAAKARGVAIRIVADASQASGQGSEISTLEGLGFNLKRASGLGTGIMHNKYMIIDGGFLLTGSYNWSVSAEDYNFENAVFISGSPVIQSYIEDFNRLWNR